MLERADVRNRVVGPRPSVEVNDRAEEFPPACLDCGAAGLQPEIRHGGIVRGIYELRVGDNVTDTGNVGL
jgi:hypothetical protein